MAPKIELLLFVPIMVPIVTLTYSVVYVQIVSEPSGLSVRERVVVFRSLCDSLFFILLLFLLLFDRRWCCLYCAIALHFLREHLWPKHFYLSDVTFWYWCQILRVIHAIHSWNVHLLSPWKVSLLCSLLFFLKCFTFSVRFMMILRSLSNLFARWDHLNRQSGRSQIFVILACNMSHTLQKYGKTVQFKRFKTVPAIQISSPASCFPIEFSISFDSYY